MKDIKRTFFKYVSLNIIGMIGISFYILADTFFVAQGVGTIGLAALNIAIPVYSLIHAIGLMIGMGSATRYSLSKTRDVFTQSIYLIAFFTAVFYIMSLFPEKIAYFLGADSKTLAHTTIYLKILLWFSPMFMLNNCFICFVRNDRNPNLAMVSMFLGSISNIILDYIFIFPCGMGMLGAAVATGISPVVGLAVMSLHFIRKKNTFSLVRISPNIKSFKDILSIGVSTFVTEVSVGIVMIVLNLIIMQLNGNVGVAAYGVVANVAIVVTSIFTGIAQGMQPIVSKSYAKADMLSVKKVLKYSVITTFSLCVVFYIISWIFTDEVVSVFNSEKDAILADIAFIGIRIYFTSFFFSGFNIVVTVFFSALGNAREAFLASILRGIIIIIPVAVIMSFAFSMNGTWLSATVAEGIVSVICAAMLFNQKH